ncbi:MAG: helix-turn-helix transcriptional regulator [Clostridia bacterium]|nr:helix-turn-helix transcriptional regulator [Clostridia bacterium]
MQEEIYHIYQKGKIKELIQFTICGTTFPDKKYEISRPNSETACIEYIEEGSGTVYLDEKRFFPVAGDSYFLAEGKDQYYFSDREQPWKKHFVNVSGKLLKFLVEGYGLQGISHFKGLSIGEEIKRVIEIVKNSEEDCSLQLIAILNEIFLKMYCHIKEEKEGRQDVAAEMRDFLDTQITSKFCMAELCKYVAKSESQAIRIFKNAYGITPYAYLLNKKMEFAKNLLSSTDLSIKEISEKLCFSDEYYFSNLFKVKTSSSPSAYRKKVRESANKSAFVYN